MKRAAFLLALWPLTALAEPMTAIADYDKARLLGDWYEINAIPSILEVDCHGSTVAVEPRDDSRLTMKIDCHKGAVDGKVLQIEGIMAETAPGTFQVRFVRLTQLGNLDLMVLWQSEDNSVVALASPFGDVAWVWAKTLDADPTALATAKQALVTAGYRESAIAPVDQGK